MGTIQEMANLLAGEVASLPPLIARAYVNKAIEDVKKDNLWSWNIQEGILLCPAIITTGAAAITQYSNSITFNSASITALNAADIIACPILGRQFRVGGGPLYTLIGYDGASGIATLDRIYTETTNATATYQVYKAYYGPPSLDGITPNYNFLRYLTILNPIQGYTLRGRRLYMTRDQLNAKDPMRGAVGSPYYAASFRPTPNSLVGGTLPNGPNTGIMQYELWPHPTYQVALICQFEASHTPLGPNDYLPAQAVATLIEYKAKEYAYRWGMLNSGRLKELRSVNWSYIIADIQKTFKYELVIAKTNDREISTKIIRPGSNSGLLDLYGPIDSNFSQSHDYPSGFPDWY